MAKVHSWRMRMYVLLVMTCFWGGAFTLVADAATEQTGATLVTLNVAEAIEVDWPDAMVTLGSAVVPGQEAVSGAVRFLVRCNSTWGLQIQSDDGKGKLRELNMVTKEYIQDGITSKNSLEWRKGTDSFTKLSSTPAPIVSNEPATGEAGKTVIIHFMYLPSFDDEPLPVDHVYGATITYTASTSY